MAVREASSELHQISSRETGSMARVDFQSMRNAQKLVKIQIPREIRRAASHFCRPEAMGERGLILFRMRISRRLKGIKMALTHSMITTTRM